MFEGNLGNCMFLIFVDLKIVEMKNIVLMVFVEMSLMDFLKK